MISIERKILHKLGQFQISPRGVYRGGQLGNRRSASRGIGLEFADHKGYSVGDDIRYLDWNVYGRLEELFIKVFEQEEALPVYILVDVSGSMALGNPSKADFAKSIAACLAYVGLANQDFVRVCLVADGLAASTKPLSGKTAIYSLLEFLDKPPQGETDITRALQTFMNENRQSGVVIILSDFLDPKGVLEGIRLMYSRRFGIYGLHIIAPEELAPDISGDAELFDAETERTLKVPLRRDTMERYSRFLQAHLNALRDDLQRYGVRYLRLPVNHALNEVLFTILPREGVLT